MSAADSLARWREAEQGATEGPWEVYNPFATNNYAVIAGGEDLATDCEGVWYFPNDATFIAASREAVPALLAFAEAVLAKCDQWADLDPQAAGDGHALAEASVARARDYLLGLAEQHLGGAR